MVFLLVLCLIQLVSLDKVTVHAGYTNSHGSQLYNGLDIQRTGYENDDDYINVERAGVLTLTGEQGSERHGFPQRNVLVSGPLEPLSTYTQAETEPEPFLRFPTGSGLLEEAPVIGQSDAAPLEQLATYVLITDLIGSPPAPVPTAPPAITPSYDSQIAPLSFSASNEQSSLFNLPVDPVPSYSAPERPKTSLRTTVSGLSFGSLTPEPFQGTPVRSLTLAPPPAPAPTTIYRASANPQSTFGNFPILSRQQSDFSSGQSIFRGSVSGRYGTARTVIARGVLVFELRDLVVQSKNNGNYGIYSRQLQPTNGRVFFSSPYGRGRSGRLGYRLPHTYV